MVRGEETVLADAANPLELFATAHLRTMCVSLPNFQPQP